MKEEIALVHPFSTERLLLLPLTPKDAADVFELFTDKKVLKNYGIPAHKNLEETRKLIRLLTNQQHLSWGIRQKQKPDKLIGICSLHDWNKRESNIEIGCTLASRYWGMGIMQEAFKALLDYTQQTLPVKQVIGKTTAENTKAIRLVEKLGFMQKDTYCERQKGGKQVQVVILVKELP
jgi:ribosomal-protein-alanine N-acetyltransferase